MRLTLDPGPEDETCAAALTWAEAHLVALGPADRDRVLLALGEAVANAVRHGHGRVEVALDAAGAACTLTVTDEARGLRPEWLHAATLPASGQTHGRGLYLLTTLADRWSVLDGGLRLTFVAAPGLPMST